MANSEFVKSKDTSSSEQYTIRCKKRKALYEGGINPYPSLWEVNIKSQEVYHRYNGLEKGQKGEDTLCISGRMMSRRIMGKAAFVHIQDSQGMIQVYLKRDVLGEAGYDELFKSMLDLGDIVGVKGQPFRTQRNELSIYATQLVLLTKTLRPLPTPKTTMSESGEKIVYDVFSDKELRYRQRYLDLLLNTSTRDVFQKRTRLIDSMRTFMNTDGYMEVETPILQPIYGGANAKPFMTYLNALDMKLYLRIANELYLKRLLIGGYEGVYEFAKDFRNEGLSRFHNPEFTQLELYVAYKDYKWMMNYVEQMLEKVMICVNESTKITTNDVTIDMKTPWPRYSFFSLIKKYTQHDLRGVSLSELCHVAKVLNVSYDVKDGEGKILDAIFSTYVEPKLIQPTFVVDYPLSMSPLAKKHHSEKDLVERFECICNGKEMANGFSELNDPIDQRQRFEAQLSLRQKGDEEAMAMDEDFIRALEYGMPPTAGVGIGIDRLTMLMTGAVSIRDVLFFPFMRAE